jgi:hypothetical protein
VRAVFEVEASCAARTQGYLAWRPAFKSMSRKLSATPKATPSSVGLCDHQTHGIEHAMCVGSPFPPHHSRQIQDWTWNAAGHKKVVEAAT